MKRILFIWLLLCIVQGVAAQQYLEDPVTTLDEFSVLISRLNVNQDPRLNKLVENHIEKNGKNNGVPGYRVEIFFKSGATAREEALKVKSEFMTAFPDINVHVKFISPDFKVRVGDYRTKNEALKLLKQLEGKYKAFIVPDIIDFPKLDP